MERFWSKVDKSGPGGCWLWTAAIRPNGYGHFATGTHGNQQGHNAHRFAYELAVGPIPDGLVLDHLCGVRHCVNPAHLEAVTQRVNVLRAPRSLPAINIAKTHCPHDHPYDEANTCVKSDGRRACRACAREYARRQRASA